MNRKLILAAALAAGSLVGVAQAAPAVVAGTYYGGQTYYGPAPQYSYDGPSVYVQAAPPAPVYEPVPAPRAGFVWSPGYHDWRDGRYVWLSGQWLPARAGYAWRAPEWQRRNDGSWFLVGGTWVLGDNYSYNRPYGYRDRDHDGVPNRYDRNDRNPYRY
jgi:hypothetical protein